jgi:hypothetical protein
MRTILISLSCILTIIATFPYILEIVRGKTKPQVVSWFTWAAILAIGAEASLAQHQIPATVYSLSCSLECALIVVLGWKYGERHFTKLDAVSMCGAIVGLLTLILLKSPPLAVTTAIITDLLGALPTIKHCWEQPQEESWHSYALYGLGSGFALLAANFGVFTAIAYPIYLFGLDTALTVIVLGSPHRNQAAENISAIIAPPGDSSPVLPIAEPNNLLGSDLTQEQMTGPTASQTAAAPLGTDAPTTIIKRM